MTPQVVTPACFAPGCMRERRSSTCLWCNKHYQQIQAHGCLPSRSKKDPREVRVVGGFACVDLCNEQGEVLDVGFTDARHADRIAGRCWWRKPHGQTAYACTWVKQPSGKRTYITMGHLIINVPPGKFLEHANRNGLDAREGNLRPATHSENMRNRKVSSLSRSGYKNVIWDARSGQFVIKIIVGADPVLAARAADAALRIAHGDFARMNLDAVS